VFRQDRCVCLPTDLACPPIHSRGWISLPNSSSCGLKVEIGIACAAQRRQHVVDVHALRSSGSTKRGVSRCTACA
jgi:hypothetical protein